MKPVILVDGSSYFFRAFHAMPPLTTSQGQPVGAIYGVINMIRRLIKDFLPDHLAIVFDTRAPTFRETLYPAYKAHRSAMPEDLTVQFEPLVDVLRLMGLAVFMKEGVEADDVIGTLARQQAALGLNVIISTSDKDFAQLVNDHITLLNTMTGQSLDRSGVYQKLGVWPEQVIDYLALVGDPVDNVPGVAKCGPKTAAKWLAHYGTLEALMQHADEITGKIGESLRNSFSFLPLSKTLVTLKTDVPLPEHFSHYTRQPPEEAALFHALQALEFKNFLKEWTSPPVATALHDAPAAAPVIAVTALTLSNWEATLRTLSTAKQLAFYLDPATRAGLSLAIDGAQAFWISFEIIPIDRVFNALKPLFESPTCQVIGHDLKANWVFMEQHHLPIKTPWQDTLLLAYVINSSQTPQTLPQMISHYLKETAPLSPPLAAALIMQLYTHLAPQLTPMQHQHLMPLELALIPVLAHMEHHGVLIDETILQHQSTALKIRLTALEAEAHQGAGKSFNLQSPAQLQRILFEEQGLPILEKTPTGQPSTAEHVLQELAQHYRLPCIILEHRHLAKLVSTYLDALPLCMDPHTHRLHTSFNQAITVTGRLSSSEPNLQNIPIRSVEGRAIRRAFVAPLGACLVSADYSQIELRIMAHLSQDSGLQNAFAEDLDIHTATAAELFEVPLAAVDPEQRRRAKVVNFGLIYGMSAFGLSKQLNVSRQDAEQMIHRYFERYPGVKLYRDRIRQQALEEGFVETLSGRRLYLPDIRSTHVMKRKAAERMAINAPMQGTAAELIKLAMIHLAEWQTSQGLGKAVMVLQVHDELLFEVQLPYLEEVKAVVRDRMEHVMRLSVPLRVAIGIGQHWGEAH